MKFYSGYTVSTLLKEKAVYFFMLLNEMYAINAESKLEDINIISIPYMEQDQAQQVIDYYKSMSYDIGNNENYSDIDKLKQLL